MSSPPWHANSCPTPEDMHKKICKTDICARDEEESDILIAKIRDMKTHLISTVSAFETSQREHGIEIAALSDKLKTANDKIKSLQYHRCGCRRSREIPHSHDASSQTVVTESVTNRLDSYVTNGNGSPFDSGLNTIDFSVSDSIRRLTQERDAAMSEKDRAKSMLALLKMHITESDVLEEDKIERQVQAGLEPPLQDHKCIRADLGYEKWVADRKDLTLHKQLNRQLHCDVGRLNSILEAKDNELSNLHSALGELSYENEAGVRMRRRIRELEDELGTLHDQIGKERSRLNSVIDEQSMSSLREAQAIESAAEALECQQKLQEGIAVLKNALKHSAYKLKQCGPESGLLVDRRIVIQLLVSYLEKGCSDEVLCVMSKVLGFSASDAERIRNARKCQGLLGRFVRSPFSIFYGAGASSSNQSRLQDVDLAEAWVDYLIQSSDDGRAWESDAINES